MSKKLTKVELEKLVEELNTTIENAYIENRKLVEKITTLSKENEQLKVSLKDSKIELDKIKEKLEINRTARQEDAEKIRNAEVLSATLEKREEELKTFFGQRETQYQRMVAEQNETIINQFEIINKMFENQEFFYRKYKEIFIKENNGDE